MGREFENEAHQKPWGTARHGDRVPDASQRLRHDSVEPFEAALAETSPVIATLFTGPNEARASRSRSTSTRSSRTSATSSRRASPETTQSLRRGRQLPRPSRQFAMQLSSRWKAWRSEWRRATQLPGSTNRGREADSSASPLFVLPFSFWTVAFWVSRTRDETEIARPSLRQQAMPRERP
jgi:hypothetical protein